MPSGTPAGASLFSHGVVDVSRPECPSQKSARKPAAGRGLGRWVTPLFKFLALVAGIFHLEPGPPVCGRCTMSVEGPRFDGVVVFEAEEWLSGRKRRS